MLKKRILFGWTEDKKEWYNNIGTTFKLTLKIRTREMSQ